MAKDLHKNLKWLEQELLAEDRIHRDFSKLPDPEYHKDEELLELVDMLIREDDPEEEIPIRNHANRYGGQTKGQRAQRAREEKQFDESSAVLTKTRSQLRREAKQRKQAEKKAAVNGKLGGLVFLAVLECIGILLIIGWWLQ